MVVFAFGEVDVNVEDIDATGYGRILEQGNGNARGAARKLGRALNTANGDREPVALTPQERWELIGVLQRSPYTPEHPAWQRLLDEAVAAHGRGEGRSLKTS